MVWLLQLTCFLLYLLKLLSVERTFQLHPITIRVRLQFTGPLSRSGPRPQRSQHRLTRSGRGETPEQHVAGRFQDRFSKVYVGITEKYLTPNHQRKFRRDTSELRKVVKRVRAAA